MHECQCQQCDCPNAVACPKPAVCGRAGTSEHLCSDCAKHVTCDRCGGDGYYATGPTDRPIQEQCEACFGSGRTA
jgi:hypothetical protein